MKLMLTSVVLGAIGFAQLPPPCPPKCPPPARDSKAGSKEKQSKDQKPQADGQKKTVR